MEKKSLNQPIYKIIILFFLSAGLYMFPWVYKNWQIAKEEGLGEHRNPFWLTFSLIIPIFSLFVLHDQLESIKEKIHKKKIHSGFSASGMIWYVIFINVISVIWFPFMLLGFWLPLRVQMGINKLYKERPEFYLTAGEIIVTIIGIVFWVCWIRAQI